MEHLDGPFGFIDVEHFDEPVAFGAVGGAVVHDFHVADATDALEKVDEISFGNVVGQIADVNAWGFDAVAVSSAAAFWAVTPFWAATFAVAAAFAFALARWGGWIAVIGAEIAGVGFDLRFRVLPLGVGLAGGAGVLAGGFLVEADELEEFLPPTEFDRGVFSGWGVAGLVGRVI
jgi:hypothetical protein